MRPLMEGRPWVASFFVAYIAFCSFAVLNVITAIYVSAAEDCARSSLHDKLAADIAWVLQCELHETISKEMFVKALGHPLVQGFFKDLDMDSRVAESLFDAIDYDSTRELVLDD